jgi:hypothetical protein
MLKVREEYMREEMGIDWGFVRKFGEGERAKFDALQLFLNHVVLVSPTFELHVYLNVVTECLTLD